MRYKIVTATSIDSLEKQVNEAIQDGWKPLGGICYNEQPPNYGTFACQTMIKVGTNDD